MSWNQQPENAFRRAQELINIAQPESALNILHEVISNRRNRTWSLTHEQIMITYIDLCLTLNKTREAKDGLHQYRNLSQSQAPGSLEKVVKYLIEQSELKCLEAKELTSGGDDKVVPVAAADLDNDAASPDTNNMMLLSTLTADPAQNQLESTLLIPRIKFLWEAYRAVLDILKSNSKLERLYHLTAGRALNFCSEYKRNVEFKRLCDLLRMHLQNLQKYGSFAAMAKIEEGGKPNNRVRGWEGWTSESIELHLQTRFTQLETASTLHLYTEGFRTVEDIFNILQISNSRRKVAGGSAAPKAKIMAAYYEKLTTLFWVSENYLFHAFAWYKFYTLCREYNRGMTVEQKTQQASAVLLSALCIPSLPDKAASAQQSDDGAAKIKATIKDDIAKEKTARMATLLGFHTRNPTREALLSEIRANNVMADVPDYLRDLYKVLEENVNPLVLVQRARPLLDRLRSEVDTSATGSLNTYVEPIISVLLLKLMHSLSASYHTISLDHIKSLTDGLGVTFTQVEKAIISTATHKNTTPLRVRIDHRANCLRFGDISGSSDAQFESDAMRSQLTILSKQLHRVCNVINPPDLASIDSDRQALYANVRDIVDQEHSDLLQRKDLIETRKEETERLAQEELKEKETKRIEAITNAKAEEQRRLVREQHLREKEKQDKIKKEMEMTEKKKILKAMGQNVETMTATELTTIDADKLVKEHAAKAAKKKDNAERKVKEVQRKLDYIVRATRIEEVPLIKSRREEKLKSDKESYEADVVKKAQRAKLKWEDDCKAKSTLSGFSVFDFMNKFEKQAMNGRIRQHELLCEEEDQRAEEIAEKAKLQRARNRKDEEIRMQKEKEETLKREEEAKRAEEDRQQREEERRKKEAEMEEIRRKKEAERDALRRSREPSGSANVSAPSSSAMDKATGSRYVPPSRRGASTGNAWGRGGGESSDSRGSGSAWGGSSYGGGRYDGGERGGENRSYGSNRDERVGDRYGFGGDRGDRVGDRYGSNRGDRNDRDNGGEYNRGVNRGNDSYGPSGDQYKSDRGSEPRSNTRWNSQS
uniref:Eukaryotic translation initiation factor 3 subunit A n=1 Tax=Chaetoceros debilis TaxID=122233 RepID=A0A7S3PZF8_9STRA|mmetsp:Transcript_2859/g.4188  ORF Transcript_2859/g.4188 Transcript_2859/m.4188 type:complete len:1049 (+) Transcript_2859:111-3257(+)